MNNVRGRLCASVWGVPRAPRLFPRNLPIGRQLHFAHDGSAASESRVAQNASSAVLDNPFRRTSSLPSEHAATFRVINPVSQALARSIFPNFFPIPHIDTLACQLAQAEKKSCRQSDLGRRLRPTCSGSPPTGSQARGQIDVRSQAFFIQRRRLLLPIYTVPRLPRLYRALTPQSWLTSQS